ncbi:MAG TPA: flagellar basal body rod protein FlgB [Methylomirabilota bacterium]|jgi:flagellar basal-body rod protein FlgB|nr:flagellar basal body rod protein FlgB [Methylomirabilota bacterium]
MAGLTLFGPTHTLLTTAMRLRAARHEILSANIANADTPGYHPRDLQFSGVLQALVQRDAQASGRQNGRLLLASTHPWHLRPGMRNALVTTEDEGEGRLDQNRVDIDREMTQLAENALLHETTVTLLSRKLAGLRYAISEGRG